MTKCPRVSVLIPAYNAMDYLPDTLETVLAQDFQDYEVVIVNDGSSDSIEDWFSHQSDSRLRLVSQSNKGLAGARNTGIRESKGEYLALLDADDLWHPSKLGLQVKMLDQNSTVGLVYTWMTLIDHEGRPTGRFLKAQEEGWVWPDLMNRNFVGCGSTPLVRRSCFDHVGLFDENLGSYMEDLDMWLRLALNYQFKVVKQPLVFYRQRPNSASKNYEAMLRSATILLEKAFSNPPANISTEELSLIKEKSYGNIKLSLAWQPLLSTTRDFSKSKELMSEALEHTPSLRFSWQYVRLYLTMSAMKLLGSRNYAQLLEFVYQLRSLRFVKS